MDWQWHRHFCNTRLSGQPGFPMAIRSDAYFLEYKVFGANKRITKLIRESYHGGKTAANKLKPSFEISESGEKPVGYAFDINSAYPYVCSLDLPIITDGHPMVEEYIKKTIYWNKEEHIYMTKIPNSKTFRPTKYANLEKNYIDSHFLYHVTELFYKLFYFY